MAFQIQRSSKEREAEKFPYRSREMPYKVLIETWSGHVGFIQPIPPRPLDADNGGSIVVWLYTPAGLTLEHEEMDDLSPRSPYSPYVDKSRCRRFKGSVTVTATE